MTGGGERVQVMLVEDDPDVAFGVRMGLTHESMDVRVETSLAEAQRVLESVRVDVMLVDLGLPDARETQAIERLRAAQPRCPLIVLTGRSDARFVVEAMRMGATDYLTKPARLAQIVAAIREALNAARGEEQSAHIIGDSPVWARAKALMQAAADSPTTAVLLSGEPGVGKEVAAGLIHTRSMRRERPMITVNVACLPASLVESELFGHEAGAFTGARQLHRGVFEQADGGTLFLDEIGELPLALQARLLRVLEGHPFRRLGSEHVIQPDVRVLSATNRDLAAEVAAGRFRADLYHRLRVLEIVIPPLRTRHEDIRRLALHFFSQLGAQMGWPSPDVDEAVFQALELYPWPGNVRELRNVIERALVLGRGATIRREHLPDDVRSAGGAYTERERAPTSGAPVSEPEDWSLAAAERRHVGQVWRRCEGNLSLCARTLQITRQTLRRKLRGYGLYEREPS